jgi:hypothetical protein
MSKPQTHGDIPENIAISHIRDCQKLCISDIPYHSFTIRKKKSTMYQHLRPQTGNLNFFDSLPTPFWQLAYD